MARLGLDYKELAKIATALLKQNKIIPTLEVIRDALPTTTSNSTLVKYVRQWKEERILMSAELASDQFQLSSGNISKHFEEIWQDLNKAREQEIQKDKAEKLQKIAELESERESLSHDLKKEREENQLLQKKCNEYQLTELKQNVQIRDLEKEREILQEKLQQTERLFPALRDETQKRIHELQAVHKEALQGFVVAEEFLKQKHTEQVNRLVAQLEQAIANHDATQSKLQKELSDLQDRWLTRENEYKAVELEYHALHTKHDLLKKTTEKESTLSEKLDRHFQEIATRHQNFQKFIQQLQAKDECILDRLGNLDAQMKNIEKKLP